MSHLVSVTQIIPSSPLRKQLRSKEDIHDSYDSQFQRLPPILAFQELCLLSDINVAPNNKVVKPTSSPHSSPGPDYERVANICSLFLTRTFRCPQTTDDVSHTQGATQMPKLTSFITQLLYTSGLPSSWALDAMTVLKYLRLKVPQSEGMKLSGHRLFLASFILVAKERVGGQFIFQSELWDKSGSPNQAGVGKVMKRRRREKHRDGGRVTKDLWWSAISGFNAQIVEDMQYQLLQHLN